MKVVICMPTGEDGIQSQADIIASLEWAVTLIGYGNTSGEFFASDGTEKNVVTYEVTEN